MVAPGCLNIPSRAMAMACVAPCAFCIPESASWMLAGIWVRRCREGSNWLAAELSGALEEGWDAVAPVSARWRRRLAVAVSVERSVLMSMGQRVLGWDWVLPCDRTRRRGFGLGGQGRQFSLGLRQGLLVVPLNLLVNLTPMHGNMDGSFDAHFDDVAFQTHDFDSDATVNNNAFTWLAGEDEHKASG